MSSLTLDTLFVILIVLLFLSAFFSGSETALMSVNKYKLKHRVKNNESSAIRVDYLLRHTDRTLGLILLLNNFVNFEPPEDDVLRVFQGYFEIVDLACFNILFTILSAPFGIHQHRNFNDFLHL